MEESHAYEKESEGTVVLLNERCSFSGLLVMAQEPKLVGLKACLSIHKTMDVLSYENLCMYGIVLGWLRNREIEVNYSFKFNLTMF